MKCVLLFFLAWSTFAVSLIAQPPEIKSYHTKNVPAGMAIDVDGRLNDLAWKEVAWATGFIQSQPDDGAPPARETAFKILYDAQNLFVAFRCFDENPEEIVSRMSRRDGFEGDWIEINIDSYFDKRTGFSFTTSVSGVKGDEFISNNGNNWDTSWDPIWDTKTNIDSMGWTAEVRIPLSQLRFGNKDIHIWGVQVTRLDFRAGQRSRWQYIPQNVSGFVSNFAELHGISGIKSQKQLEIQPYTTASVKTFEKVEGHPFKDGSDTRFDAGIDGKIGVTSDLTLDFTVNPDFGQVEADPSALTLDGFQIFFNERRPFFVENTNLFDFSIARAEAGGPFGNDNLFYSRRIGRAPRGSIIARPNEYISSPDVTSILGATKFSGKTKNGLAIGVLESITAREMATLNLSGKERSEVVEPLSNYFVGRLSKDFNEGNTVIGGMVTHVGRQLNQFHLTEQFTRSALTGGIDFKHSWKEREWVIAGNFIFSELRGSQAIIADLQRSFEHNFQRPDADHLSVDETATSLKGHGGNLSIANYGGKDRLSFQGGVTWRNPGIDLNDIGFMNQADFITHYFWAGYRYPKTYSIFNGFRINYNHWKSWTYGGENIYNAVNSNIHTQFINQWRIGGGITYIMKNLSTRGLFGGPMLRNPPGTSLWTYINSDQRKKISLGFHGSFYNSRKIESIAASRKSFSFFVRWQPTDAINLSISPDYSIFQKLLQNVSYDKYQDQDRYITANVKQNTFSLSTRANINLSPTLTIQYWGQPFISRGNYKDFKYITDSRAGFIHDQYSLYAPGQLFQLESGDFIIDENQDGQTDYQFGNPDFNFMQFRSNLVMRWEYKTGSELFLVWSQSNTASGDPSHELFPSLKNNLFKNTTENILLMKLTYRFIR